MMLNIHMSFLPGSPIMGGDCLAIVAVATSWALMRVPRVPVHEEAGGGFRT